MIVRLALGAACVFALPGIAFAQAPPRPDTAVRLPPIEVAVTRSAEPLFRAPYAVSALQGRITVADLGLSLPAALAAVPGVIAESHGTAARDEAVSIRGFGARAAFGVRGIRILLDGIPLTVPDGQSQLTNVNMRRIARVEVLRGAASALYGNATGGVINLESSRVVPERIDGEGRIGAGADGLVTADAQIAAPLGRAALDISAERTSATGYRAQSRYEVWRANVTTHVPVGRGTVTWLADLGSFPEAQDPGALTAAEVAADPRQANPSYASANAGKDVWQVLTGVSLRHPLGAEGHFEVATFASRRDLDNPLPFSLISLGRWAYGARGAATVPLLPGDRLTLVAGADAQWLHDDRTNRTPDGAQLTRDQTETVRELGPFVQLRYRPLGALAAEAGTRYDVVSFGVTDHLLTDGDASGARDMRSPSATVGLSVTLAPPLVVWGRIGTAFETPTTTELANTPDGDAGFNPNLDPQNTTEVEAGVRLGHGGARIGVTAFHDAVRNELIPFEVPSDPGRRYYRNAGRGRHQGLEAEAGARWAAGVWVSAAYTLSDLRFTDYATDSARYDGNRIPGVPMHFGRVAGGVQWGVVSVESELRAASKVYVDDANSATADAWWVADVAVAADVRVGGALARPSIGLENAFERRYVGSVAVNGTFGRYYEPAAGRTLYASLSVRWR
jgi:iron complex outermembrane recepter protein